LIVASKASPVKNASPSAHQPFSLSALLHHLFVLILGQWTEFVYSGLSLKKSLNHAALNFIKPYKSYLTIWRNSQLCLPPGKYFHPSLIFAGKEATQLTSFAVLR